MKISTTLKSISVALIALSPLCNASARQLTPDEALQRAMSNFKGMRMPGNSRNTLTYTESLDGENLVYVFNNSSDGFFLVGGDDRMAALLGYSDHGTFDYDTAPDALKWLLGQYAGEAFAAVQIIQAEDSGLPRLKAPKQDERQPIEALIKTKWGQNAPFNLDCPSINGHQCVTGCVATALAQIIKHFAYPATGNGTHSYGWNNQQLEYDYSAATFDYSAMLDLYNDIFVPDGKVDATEEQEKAVANLMYACGVAVNMGYNLEGSNATDISIPYALSHYFGYDEGVRYLKRDLFLTPDWETLIYSELEAGRPVIYGGQTLSGGGHQFICDGYNGNSLFHINWGWEGLADGYYRLSSLEPEYQGTGGFTGGYNVDQSIVCGIQPKSENSSRWYSLYGTGSLSAEEYYGQLAIRIGYKGIQNYSTEAVNANFMIKAVSDDGKEYYSAKTTSVEFEGAGSNGTDGTGLFGPVYLPANLPAGTYKCYLCIKTENGIQDILFPISDNGYFILEMQSDGKFTIQEGTPVDKAIISVTNVRFLTDIVSGEPVRMQISLENQGSDQYSGYLTIRFFNQGSDQPVTELTPYMIKLPAGNIAMLNPYFIMPLKPGTYDMICFDKYDEPVSDAVTMVVGDSGVDEIMTASDTADIYTAGGVLVCKNAGREAISSLPKGLYILNIAGKTYKVIK